jgi:lantibiotic biosynthesis protein
MKKTKVPYQSFDNFVIRTPLLSYSFFKKLTSQKVVSDDDFKNLFNQPEIKEAVFLATPILHEELEKWTNGFINDIKKIEKLKHSFLKYISRMCTRCTPFGLFAGCAVGKFDNKSNIVQTKLSGNHRHTRLDMNYLVALSQSLAKDKNIRNQILFFPNTSIYKIQNQLRYIEYEYFNTNRKHHIIGVDYSIYLEKVISACNNGLLFGDLVDLLVDEENSIDTVIEFLEELIESQILINELEPSLSGPEFLEHIIEVLSKIIGVEEQLSILRLVETKLKDIDLKIGNDYRKYIEISVELKKLKTDFDIKYLFQTDVILKPESNILDKSIINSVIEGLSLFNKITATSNDNLLNSFKDTFYDRYEESEISLARALDVEIGIGYRQNQNSLDINPLIDDIILPSKKTKNYIKEIKLPISNSIIQKKIVNSLANQVQNIILSDEDFEGFSEDWNDLSDTISAMIEVVIINGERKIIISSAGGSSAANLLGRFCHGDKSLLEHTQKIIEFEKNINSDKILAEIIHLPESRVGNVLMKPILRDYEIPYLAKSLLENEKQINISDLYVSVRGNKIILKSKKNNQEVIPRLTNAHNYTSNSLPIYHFLADMQSQGKRIGIGLFLGSLTNNYEFTPRIEYKDLILSVASWNLKKVDFEKVFESIDNDLEILNLIRNIRLKKNIPQLIILSDGDHELLVNLENLSSIKMFLYEIKNKAQFKLKEFLFDEKAVVESSDGKEYYTNQIILAFHKN